MLSTRESALLSFAGAFAIAIALHGADLGHVPWAINRAAGLAAYATLATSVILGLLISTKAADGLVPRALVFEMHQFLSVMALVLVAVHVGVLLFDRFLGMGPVALVVPFASPYEPLLMGLGVIAAWLAAITTGSFWMRARIGYRTWRRLHYVTFLCFIMALWHGIAAGTDTGLAPVYWMYVLSGAAIAGLLTVRIGESVLKRSRTVARVPSHSAAGNSSTARPAAGLRKAVEHGRR